MYHFQGDMCSINFGINDFFHSSINIPVITGPKADTISLHHHIVGIVHCYK